MPMRQKRIPARLNAAILEYLKNQTQDEGINRLRPGLNNGEKSRWSSPKKRQIDFRDSLGLNGFKAMINHQKGNP